MCGICIVEIDHHCGVVANCIAKKNLWNFRLMIIGFVTSFLFLYVYAWFVFQEEFLLKGKFNNKGT